MRSSLKQDYPIEIIRKPYRRTMGLRVHPSGKVLLTANKTTSVGEIARFIKQSESWLQNALSEYEMLRQRYPQKKFIAGESFLYLGKQLKLEFSEKSYAKDYRFEALPGRLVVYKPKQVDLFSEVKEKQIKKAMQDFYKSQGSKLLKNRVHFWSQKMQLYPTKVTIRGQKSRWGSCSSRGTINLNWKLIASPLEVLDYVVIHELAHLRHQNHSAKFWGLVQDFCPSYKNLKNWLRDHQYELDFLNGVSELYN